jgi:3-phosphoshikimate 1-carboxyvinyltransferase
MNVVIGRSTVAGTVQAPPSKSYTHRAILAGGFSDEAVVSGPLLSADTKATMRVVEGFGGNIGRTDGEVTIQGFDGRPGVPEDVLDCANSGTTMRLSIATAALADGLTVLTGDDSLRTRPQGPLLEAIQSLSGRAESTRGNGQGPIVVGGPIDGGSVTIPGDVSSQFVTALLMAGAVTPEGIDLELETELKSAPYVEITLEVLDAFGVDARETREGYVVQGGQSYRSDDAYAVPGDFSSISYLLAAGAVAGVESVTVQRARPSAQGDSAIVDVLERMGGSLDWDRKAGSIESCRSSLSGVTVDVSDTPDLLPTIAALGAIADGETRLTDCEHVRYKETDRVSAMAEELSALGARTTEREDELIVHGGESDLVGTTVDGRADHRIVMALAVAALAAEGETTIIGAEHVEVSFPDFFDVLEGLGADVTHQE